MTTTTVTNLDGQVNGKKKKIGKWNHAKEKCGRLCIIRCGVLFVGNALIGKILFMNIEQAIKWGIMEKMHIAG